MNHPLPLPRMAGRHVVVGVACALLNIGLVHVGTSILRWPYLAAVWLTCFITIPLSYFLHRRHSFRLAGRANWGEFGRFLGQQLLQFGAGVALLSVGVEWLALSPTAAMVLATAVLWAFSFASQCLWVFRGSVRAKVRP